MQKPTPVGMGSTRPGLRRARPASSASIRAVLGNAELNPDVSDVANGFDRVLAPVEGERDAGETIDQLLGHLHELSGYPLFVWLHLTDPLGPYDPPESFRFEYLREEATPAVAQSAAPAMGA